MSARASRPPKCSWPDNLTFSTPQPVRLTHPDSEYFPPVGESFRATQLYLSVFTCQTQRVLISRRTPARCSRPDNLTFSILLLDEAYPSDTAIIEATIGCWREPPRQTSYLFHPVAGESHPSGCELPSPVR